MEYGLIGESLRHSFSQEIHSLLGEYPYELREIPPVELEAFMRKRDFKGINVTIPYKQAVMPFLDSKDIFAEKTGAVNTVVNRGGRLYGYNTDVEGMRQALLRAAIDPKGEKVLILGTGGTSRTAECVCELTGAREIIRVGRTKSPGCITYREAEESCRDAGIIINTTPVGMYPGESESPVDLSCFTKVRGVFDAVYNPLRTRLVLSAHEREIKAAGGLFMLSTQGVLSAEKFLNERLSDGIQEKIYESLYRKKRNIVFIGMPGSGKTTVAKALSEKTGRAFYDTDGLTEKRTGLSSGEIIEKYGEEYFRRLEKDAVKSIRQLTSCVTATGGGTVLDSENVRLLRENGVLVFLDIDISRLSPHGDRPLSNTQEALERIFEKRYGIYKAAADYVLPVQDDVITTVKKAEELLL